MEMEYLQLEDQVLCHDRLLSESSLNLATGKIGSSSELKLLNEGVGQLYAGEFAVKLNTDGTNSDSIEASLLLHT